MLSRAVQRLPRAEYHLQPCSNIPISRPSWPTITAKPTSPLLRTPTQHASSSTSSSSSTRWKSRQTRDTYTRDAKLQGLKSRAAFKLLEIDDKYHLFRRGDTVVDLGYAPGSWSQVAISKTQPGGRVVGIDVIPAQPPKGVSTLQGNFLSPEIREEVRKFVLDPERGRVRVRGAISGGGEGKGEEGGLTEDELEEESLGLLQRGEREVVDETSLPVGRDVDKEGLTRRQLDSFEGRVVNVVLSDMSAPWPQTASMWIKSVSNPYHRMMNTSGMPFRDHVGSMDLCHAALTFCYDTLITGGHFLCKFYQGSEDQVFEQRLRKLFEKVHRIKPDSSRKESKEAYFVGLRRKASVARGDVLDEGG